MTSPAPVSSSFCVPHETQLVVKQKWFATREYAITDSKGILLFSIKSKGGLFSHPKSRIYDASSGKVLLLLKEDVRWFRSSLWLAFHGDSESELCFTQRRKSVSSYEVFLSENSQSASPDFSIKKNKLWAWSSSFTIFSKGRPMAKAKRNKCPSLDYTVTVFPEMDRAFVAGLVLLWILEET